MYKYQFSFTAASLRLNDFVQVAKLRRANHVVDHVNMLGAGKSSTGIRMIAEYEKRLATLTLDQLQLLTEGSLLTQKQMAFLAVCKTYAFIRDFTVEVLREKMLLFDYEVSEGEFISFLRRKMDSHPELEKITDKTVYKIRQVTFKILEQAGIIDTIKNKTLQPQIMDNDVLNVIAADNKEWFKILFLSDMDIKNIK